MEQKSVLLGLDKELSNSSNIIDFHNINTVTPKVASVLINLYGESLLKKENLEVNVPEDIAKLPKSLLANVEKIILETGSLYEQAMWSLVMGAVIATSYKDFYCDSIKQFIEEYLIKDPEKNIVISHVLLRLEKYLRKMNPNEYPFFAFEFIHKSDNSFIDNLRRGVGYIQTYEIKEEKESTILYSLQLINSGEYFKEILKGDK